MLHIFINLVHLHLFESCDWSEQCTKSHGANECKVVEGQKICYCPDGKAIFEGSCFKGKDGRNVKKVCYEAVIIMFEIILRIAKTLNGNRLLKQYELHLYAFFPTKNKKKNITVFKFL